MIIAAEGVTVRYPRAPQAAVEAVSLTVAPGELVALLGPNGCGKTTLLRALLGAVPLAAGRVTVQGTPLAHWPPRALARVAGVVTQREETLFPLRVRDTVALGRYARLGPLGVEGPADRWAVEEAMRLADVGALAARRTDTLSGGEWQRVRIARALAQEPRLLVLDEPTLSLDLRHEMEVFELIRRLAAGGMAALLATHHLNLAARYADRLILLATGRVVAQGAPHQVLQHAVLAQVFAWPIEVGPWADGIPQVYPLRAGQDHPSDG